MHNRARENKEQLAQRKAGNLQKVEKYSLLSKVVFANHQAKKYDTESLALSAKLLELNPEVYTVWNFRRLALLALIPGVPKTDGKQMLEGELKLVERALQKNPKSYSAWHHRKWVVAQGHADLQRELVLCGRLLDLDERNFHCWSYRRYVAQLVGRTPEEELGFTTHKIEQNFSNYSSWHYRSKLLPVLHDTGCSPPPAQPEAEQSTDGTESSAEEMSLLALPHMYRNPTDSSAGSSQLPASVLDEEFELVQQALFTEPADQSAWLYHRWLLAQVMKPGIDTEVKKNTLAREAQALRELLEVEPNSKWCMLTLARVVEAQHAHQPNEMAMEAIEEVKRLYGSLTSLDNLRQQYFKDLSQSGIIGNSE
uniref:Geranylgeranyl transferase type-2 subunit alpha n=1 Tax=Pyramimonas obovata TaxID=1411642 RepID=A0A7S0QXR3_9CHLO|mmetsp:Transcript_17189/g.37381  ORF Transcript_17189/g.37381 Transcript_17189/m.37381 type:complete len:367 (+) Transcript_17189:158-1258(+)|eukprot:CAMPEP_0118948700 /NCGR_PEP_ID=MMETSP1169-20130426/48275_1 /TAXON_ID=36882 /ORGANISM="Pyramimonas obovata, Strain CCMP722" /LENGTH=366 /DNA_ID=CAMNT_0006895191 /DNA_START=112 /DNA_END=1212 /DNA_ORIENTATION=-